MRAMSRASRHNPTYLQPIARLDIGDEDDPDTPKSKSQRKRDMQALQELDMHRKVQLIISGGIRTGDIMTPGATKVGTAAMGDAVLANL